MAASIRICARRTSSWLITDMISFIIAGSARITRALRDLSAWMETLSPVMDAAAALPSAPGLAAEAPSAKFFSNSASASASPWLRRTTCTPPVALAGVSRLPIIWAMRWRVIRSPLMISRLVRSSATTVTPPSLVLPRRPPVCGVRLSSIFTMSPAKACSSLITCTSSDSALSRLAMIASMRRILSM